MQSRRMSERRSSRSRGTVKYSGFDDGNESDDDFAESSHPPKKQKSSKTDEAAKKLDKDTSLTLDRDVKKHVTASQNSTKKSRRAPLSEKIYKRELQEALELSLFETGKSHDVGNHDLDNNKPQPSEALTFAADVDITRGGHLVSSSGNICTDTHSQKSTVNTTTNVTSSSQYAHGTVVMDDCIELVESENVDSSITQHGPTHKTHNRQACKRPLLVDKNDETSDESDFNPDDDSDDDENRTCDTNDDDDDEETGNTGNCRSKRNKTVNPKRKNKSSAIVSKMPKSSQIGSMKGARKTVKSQPSGSLNVAAVSSTASSLLSNKTPVSVTRPSTVTTKSTSAPQLSSQKIPSSLVSRWKPPSLGSSTQASAATVRSPSSGLRLGLSRNQRVKPLHPSVQVS